MKPVILLVDDEQAIRNSVKRVLRNEGLDFLEAGNGREALGVLSAEHVDLVLLDLRMPLMNGYEFLESFRRTDQNQTVPVCVMTASSDNTERQKAIDLGADDFLEKPANVVELKTRIKSLVRISRFQHQMRDMNAQLEARVEERTNELMETVARLEHAKNATEMAYRETVMRLTMAAEMKDECTAAHLERIGHYASLLARQSGWSEEDANLLVDASKMHDIGKLGIPDSILNKPGKLTKEEFDVMKTHAEIGARILSGSRSRLLSMGATVALTHHERFDGSGYPKGSSGQDIPLVGRIVAIADVFDALMSKRSYKEAFSLDKTLEIMRADSGSHFDPELLDLFLEDVSELLKIHDQYTDVETMPVSAAFSIDHVAKNVAAARTETAPEEFAAHASDREKAKWTKEFAGQLSHELCNPAAFIDANLESLSEYFTELLSVIKTTSATNPPGQSDSSPLHDDIPALLAESRDGIRRMRRVVEDLQNRAAAVETD